jgi:hypothetical protein
MVMDKKGMWCMARQLEIVRRGSLAVLCGVLVALCGAASASAHTGEFARFNECPSTNGEVFKCVYSVTNSGSIVLGKKTTPILSAVTLQGGYSKTNREKNLISKFFAATNGVTLSKTPQNVPGGLLGIVPPEKSGALVKLLSKFFFENSLTAVYATLELAKPASEIEISEFNLLNEEGVALKLPVKVRLENPFLGSSCYVGSSSNPIIWPLTTGTTKTVEPNKPITGQGGLARIKEGGEIAELSENILVENDWSAPEATGCGGILSFLVDPIIDLELGLPARAGENTAILENTLYIATTGSVNAH